MIYLGRGEISALPPLPPLPKLPTACLYNNNSSNFDQQFDPFASVPCVYVRGLREVVSELTKGEHVPNPPYTFPSEKKNPI